jgi:hypothetical protein
LPCPWQFFGNFDCIFMRKREVKDWFMIHFQATKYFAAG